MTELERYLRVYLTKKIEEEQVRIEAWGVYDDPTSKRMLDQAHARLFAFQEILDQLDLHKDMMG